MPKHRHTWLGLQRHHLFIVCLSAGFLIFMYRILTTWNEPVDLSKEANITLQSTKAPLRSKETFANGSEFVEDARDCYCLDSETNQSHQFCHSLLVASFRIKKFDCTYLEHLKKLNLLNPEYDIKPNLNNGQVFVTGASSNHFTELQDHIGSLIEHYSSQPKTKIIAIDFGLEKHQAALIKKTCHVEYRKFDFTKYPDYVQQMFNYRWKPLVIAELLTEFSAFWWADSSIRWSENNLTFVYDAISSQNLAPYLLIDYTGHSIVAATNPRMFAYLPSDQSKLAATAMYGGGFAFVARTKQTADILKWSVLCALEQNCMAPPQSSLTCQWVGGDRWKQYAGCHRYDQSAINTILANTFHHNVSQYTTKNLAQFAIVVRGSVGKYQLKPC